LIQHCYRADGLGELYIRLRTMRLPISDMAVASSDTLIHSGLALLERGRRSSWHAHPSPQLIWPVHGVLYVETGQGMLELSEQRALWLPAGCTHRVSNTLAASLFSLYWRADLVRNVGTTAGPVTLKPLLREALRALAQGSLSGEAAMHLGLVCADLLAVDGQPSTFAFRSPHLRRLVSALETHPGDPRTLESWAHALKVSPRTLTRALRGEVGMGFSAYRRKLRIRLATERLRDGQLSKAIAYDLGFSSQSAFVAAFRRECGMTPGEFREREKATPLRR
jgi:AraC-like DNA-binding protein